MKKGNLDLISVCKYNKFKDIFWIILGKYGENKKEHRELKNVPPCVLKLRLPSINWRQIPLDYIEKIKYKLKKSNFIN